MNQGWYRVKGSSSPLGYRYYGQPLFPDAGNTFSQAAICSADQVYLVPWYTGPGGVIDQLACFGGNSVSAHMGIYAANHARVITPGALFFQTSVGVGGSIATASVNFLGTANAVMWLAIQLEEARTLNGVAGANAVATLGFETSSVASGYYGLVCSYAYASGLPTTLAIPGVQRITQTTPPPFLGVHYA